jgi:hypothetical protein
VDESKQREARQGSLKTRQGMDSQAVVARLFSRSLVGIGLLPEVKAGKALSICLPAALKLAF